jgi:hypothetical protein
MSKLPKLIVNLGHQFVEGVFVALTALEQELCGVGRLSHQSKQICIPTPT